MRTLKFIVDGQIVKPDPECDFSNLVPGTNGYLRIWFKFSEEWADCKKVVGFWSVMGREYQPQELYDGETCVIPADALRRREFKMQVFGVRKDYKITTNKVTVSQDGGIA